MVREKGLTLSVDVSKNLPLVHGDWDQLLQVMDNLLSNAIKFTPSGTITVQAMPFDDGIKVSITDTGVGIPREDQVKIFNKFHQLGDIRTGKPQGTGLGLAICKEIMLRLGGRIGCQSEVGKGSTFYFMLPLWKNDFRFEEQQKRSAVQQTDLETGRKRL